MHVASFAHYPMNDLRESLLNAKEAKKHTRHEILLHARPSRIGLRLLRLFSSLCCLTHRRFLLRWTIIHAVHVEIKVGIKTVRVLLSQSGKGSRDYYQV